MARKRAVLRLLASAVTHSAVICALLYVAGMVGVLAAPLLARNTFTDENALLVGAASSRLDPDFGRACMRSAQAASQQGDKRALTHWLLRELHAAGHTANTHNFSVAQRHQQGGGGVAGTSVVTLVRAARGDGKEALVLATPLRGDASLALGVGLHLLGHLARVPWLSRDVIWLAADATAAGGMYAAVEAWLAEYQGTDGDAHPAMAHSHASFLRSGALSAALAFDVPPVGFDELELRVQGTRGALPNLDLVSVVHTSTRGAPLRLAGHRAGQLEGGAAASPAQHVASLRAGARFLGTQLRGIPDGAHGAFLDASIDSASLAGVASHVAAAPRYRGEHAALAVGGILEGSLRSLSNMLERLHHSSAFFLLLSPTRFVAAPGFMPQVGVLLAALLLQACALATRGSEPEWGGAPGAGDWVHAAVVVAGVHCACALSRALLACVDRSGASAVPMLTACATAVCVATPQVLALVSSAARKRAARPRAWVPLKILMLLALLLWLARALVVCYALSLAGALALVPMCLAARPRAPTDSRLRTTARWLLLLAASPPVVAFALHSWLGTADLLRQLADDWRQWDSLLLPFLFGAYLPCFAVCVALLLA